MRLPDLPAGWRSMVAGLIAVGLGTFDLWHYGRENGLSVAVDEALILLGISMIAGTLMGKSND